MLLSLVPYQIWAGTYQDNGLNQNPKYVDIKKWLADTVHVHKSVQNFHGHSGQRDRSPRRPSPTSYRPLGISEP